MATTTITKGQSASQTTTITLSSSLADETNPTDTDLVNSPVHSNPPDWPTDFRRVPAYRPVNRQLDASERPYGANGLEYVFISIMMRGVRMQSDFTKFWEATGGHWWPGLTRWKIGGEW